MEKDKIIRGLVNINQGLFDIWLEKGTHIHQPELKEGELELVNKVKSNYYSTYQELINKCLLYGVKKENVLTYIEHISENFLLFSDQRVDWGDNFGVNLKKFAEAILNKVDYQNIPEVRGYPLTHRGETVLTMSANTLIFMRQISYDIIHNVAAAEMGLIGEKEKKEFVVEALITMAKVAVILKIDLQDDL